MIAPVTRQSAPGEQEKSAAGFGSQTGTQKFDAILSLL